MNLCGDTYRDSKDRGCRLPFGHDGACDARLVRLSPDAADLDDPSDAEHERQERADDEAWEENR